MYSKNDCIFSVDEDACLCNVDNPSVMRIVVVASEGIVRAVYSNCEHISAYVIDYDNVPSDYGYQTWQQLQQDICGNNFKDVPFILW